MKKIIIISIIILFAELVYSQNDTRNVITRIFEESKCKYSNRHYPDVNCNRGSYKLIFSDHFEGDALDTTKWVIETGSTYAGGANDNLYWYCPENIEVSNGFLHIKTTKNDTPVSHTYSFWDSNLGRMVEHTNNFNYNSGRIHTKYEFPINGRFEARIKLPEDKGLWPAFWLFGSDNYYHMYNELDIFEMMLDKHNEKYLQFNSYYGVSYSRSSKCGITIIDDSIDLKDLVDNFHTYTVTWTDSEIELRIDNRVKYTRYRYKRGWLHENLNILLTGVRCSNLKSDKKYFESSSYPKNQMSVILNTAIHREYGLNSNFVSKEMLVDYVRVYKSVSCYEDKSINNNLFHLNVGCLPGKKDYYVTGRNVTFSDSVSVDVCKDHSVTAIASREVIFNDNTSFTSDTNSSFIAYIAPCKTNKNVILEYIDPETDTIDDVILDALEKNDFDSITFIDIDDFQDPIWVYTSLDEDSLFIDIKTNTISNYYVEIKKEFDSTIIYQSRNLTNTFISINLLDLEEDIYVINIIDVINNRREQYLLTVE